MFSYTCPTCGVSAYSSANPANVGPCPSCSGLLSMQAQSASAPMTVNGNASASASANR
jgi:hypothetical protein